MVVEAGRALVLAFNKWDLVDEDRRYLRCFYRLWSHAVKLPGDFVRERAKAAKKIPPDKIPSLRLTAVLKLIRRA